MHEVWILFKKSNAKMKITSFKDENEALDFVEKRPETFERKYYILFNEGPN